MIHTTQTQAPTLAEGRELAVTEGVSGYWHYHLSDRHDTALAGRSLCGRAVMPSGVALEDWKKPFGHHFPKAPTWCEACEVAAALPLQR